MTKVKRRKGRGKRERQDAAARTLALPGFEGLLSPLPREQRASADSTPARMPAPDGHPCEAPCSRAPRRALPFDGWPDAPPPWTEHGASSGAGIRSSSPSSETESDLTHAERRSVRSKRTTEQGKTR